VESRTNSRLQHTAWTSMESHYIEVEVQGGMQAAVIASLSYCTMLPNHLRVINIGINWTYNSMKLLHSYDDFISFNC